jgi:hypothetical protein
VHETPLARLAIPAFISVIYLAVAGATNSAGFGRTSPLPTQRLKSDAHLVEMNAEIPPWARDGVQFALAGNAWSIRLEPSWAA